MKKNHASRIRIPPGPFFLMKKLSGQEEQEAVGYFHQAAEIAKNSTCQRDQCGSLIVKDKKIIGTGFNSPPSNLESQRKCLDNKEKYHKKVKDTTCCIHAEQRAIMDALRKNPDKIFGSRIYFARLDTSGKLAKSGQPYCTICSKMALDAGVAEFALWHENGIVIYSTEEYNLLSFNYKD